MPSEVTLFHAPQTRSSGTLTLLEELHAPYKLQVMSLKSGDHRKPDYLKVNPMGKVPAILHDGALVTEQVAIGLYLADTFTSAGITPSIGDPLRGPYLRWYVFYAASFEPAAVDKALKRDPGNPGMSPYGDFDTTIAALTKQLEKGPWMLGDRFTALDVQWGTALTWMTAFGIVEATPAVKAYTQRFGERPSVAKVRQIDEKLSKEQGA